MAFTGLDIFQMLAKDQLRGVRLAHVHGFRMKLASKNADLAACPYASDQAKAR